MPREVLILTASLAMALPQAASAYTLIPLTNFDTSGVVGSGPEGLAYGLENTDADPELERVLYVSEGDDCLNSGTLQCTIFVYDAGAMGAATFLRSFDTPVQQTRGLDLLPNGNLLATTVQGGADGLREISRLDGSLVAGGISFNFTTVSSAQLESVVSRSSTSVLFGDENTGLLYEYNPVAGVLVGLTFAEDGLLWMADDSSGGGVSLLRVLDPATGQIVPGSTINMNFITSVDDPNIDDDGDPNTPPADTSLDDNTPLVGCENEPGLPNIQFCIDPEGLAYDPVNRVLFIAFENEQRVLSWQVVGEIPEPNALALLGAGLAGTALLRRLHR
jgi:hypothetical protein